jgi:hypothetical protein
MNKILTRRQYLDTLRNNRYEKFTNINEAFSNDVNWGDSWVGRMINSIIRKAKISVNLRRISSLSKMLESRFEELYETGKIKTGEFDRKFLESKYLLDRLEEMVASESDIEDIIGHIDIIITQVSSYNLKDKDLLIKKLKEYQDYLRGLLKGKSGDSDESGDSESSDSKSSDSNLDNLEGGENPTKIFYMECRNLLQSVVDLNRIIKNNVIRFKEEEYGKKINVGVHFDISKFNDLKARFDKAQKKDKLPILRQLVQMCELGLDSYKVKKDKANINLFNSYFKKYAGLLSGMEREARSSTNKSEKPSTNTQTAGVGKSEVTQTSGVSGNQRVAKESYIFEEVDANVEKNEVHARNAWKKIIKAYEKSGIEKYISEIESMLSISSKDGKDKYKEAMGKIITIGKQVILNKKTVGNPISFDELISESAITNDIPKSISLFGRAILGFVDDEGLIGAFSSAIKPLKTFISAFSKMESNLSKIDTDSLEKEEKSDKELYKVGDVVKYKYNDGKDIGEEEITKIEGDNFFFIGKDGGELSSKISNIVSKVETKNETILRYSGFLITEATSGVNYGEVNHKFDEIFTEDIKDMFEITTEQVEKIKTAGEEGDKYIITNADPIMEIVRIFNRAWRIHTPGRIPSGRTDGKVSMSVFQEYESLGQDGSPDSPGPGPYRNIELYEKWQEAVLSILGNTKYRTTIFSDDALFVFDYAGKQKKAVMSKDDLGDSGIPEGKSKPLGKVLLRFINSLLMDSQMYKDKGAMGRFMIEYFGLGEDQVKGLGGFTYGGVYVSDTKDNQESMSTSKPQNRVKLVKLQSVLSQFDDKSDLMRYMKVKSSIDSKDLKNLVFRVKTSEGNFRYLYFIEEIRNKVYFYLVDRYCFDTKFTYMTTSVNWTDSPGFIYLVEADFNDTKLSVGAKFEFKKSEDLRKKDAGRVMEDDKMDISGIDVVVTDKESTIYLDNSLSMMNRKFEINKKSKKINNKLY